MRVYTVIDDDKWITSMKSCQVHYERNESRIIQVSKFSLKHSVRLHTLQAFGGGPPPTSYKGGCMSEYEMGKNQVNFLTGADGKFFPRRLLVVNSWYWASICKGKYIADTV